MDLEKQKEDVKTPTAISDSSLDFLAWTVTYDLSTLPKSGIARTLRSPTRANLRGPNPRPILIIFFANRL